MLPLLPTGLSISLINWLFVVSVLSVSPKRPRFEQWRVTYLVRTCLLPDLVWRLLVKQLTVNYIILYIHDSVVTRPRSSGRERKRVFLSRFPLSLPRIFRPRRKSWWVVGSGTSKGSFVTWVYSPGSQSSPEKKTGKSTDSNQGRGETWSRRCTGSVTRTPQDHLHYRHLDRTKSFDPEVQGWVTTG